MVHSSRLAEILFVGLCDKIGFPEEVAIRRCLLDLREMIKIPICLQRGALVISTGSYREGFRLKSCDLDFMRWPCKCKLINDMSQLGMYNTSKHDIIMMEDFDVPPGFVRLRLLTPTRDIYLLSSLVTVNGEAYLSSSLWREINFLSMASDKSFEHNNIHIHGPCTSGSDKIFEFDHAVGFASIIWPKQMRAWFDRCQRQSWPPVQMLQILLKNGLHCVPIGSKIVSTSNELEWRLSFSIAEQRLVFIMNHIQFLCYGLLKIFLKEIFNYKEEPLLCSYYMKTTMFWMIQQGHLRWCPNNLLDCLWKCFNYLIHCVYRENFPNFFIPQNNMFINSVVGGARKSLLKQLYQYYKMGVSCLLLSPTLRSILEPALCSPSFVLSSAEERFIGVADIDMWCRTEISNNFLPYRNIPDWYLYLKSIEKLSSFSLSPYQILGIQYATAETLVHLAFAVANASVSCTQKHVYLLDRINCNMIKLAAKLFPMSNLVYLALYYYRTAQYDKTLHTVTLCKQRLSQDFNLYCKTFDRQRYHEVVGNLPLSKRMKQSWVIDINLNNALHFIEELDLEQTLSLQNGTVILLIPPIVVIEMLSVLSHYRLGNRSQSLQSVTDLKTLLLNDDDGKYVPSRSRDISWQILGICKNTVGDFEGALWSFEESLMMEPFHEIWKATERRIRHVAQQLNINVRYIIEKGSLVYAYSIHAS
ncbi:uncharacterized protein LOC134236582 [Saccostrea cucullata]|uniref:uncharacterized protein LOC134236582 n=1 Tax=Saccostrea cuccullata TaxID=36930 RepID=UPI002ED07898